jgi:hypothetical protein
MITMVDPNLRSGSSRGFDVVEGTEVEVAKMIQQFCIDFTCHFVHK